MISIVICSINDDLLRKVCDNISLTIGVEFELLIKHNSSNKGICQVYNETVSRASYDIVCFVHEDVIFHSQNWGEHLLDLLNNQQIGLVGVSGSAYKSKYPAPWTACEKSLYRNNTIQHFSNQPKAVISKFIPEGSAINEVAVLDGVFLATRKEVIVKYPFDEKLLTGFHGYDFDISMSIGCDFKLIMTNDILIEHFSEGKFNSDWIIASINVHQKWQRELPKNRSLNKFDYSYTDYLACSCFLNILIVNQFSKIKQVRFLIKLMTRYFFFNKFKYVRSVMKNLFALSF